ncbi:MAG: MFS transporter [Bacillota bacterium]|nr:MFS transporter [Bacillota bacterium]
MSEPRQVTNWSQYRLVIGLSFVQSFIWSLVLSMFPLFARELGAREFAIGALAAVHPFLSVMGAIPMGFLANRVSRKGMFVLAYVLSLLAALAYAATTSPAGLILPQLLFGLSVIAYWPTQHAHISDNVAPAERARLFGLAMGLTGLGGVVGPVLGGRIADTMGFPAMYLLHAVVTLAGLALCTKVQTPAEAGRSWGGVRVQALTPAGARALVVRPEMRFVLFSTVVLFVQWGLRDTFLPLYAADLNLTRTAIGTLVTFQTASMSVSRLSLGVLGRRAPAGRAILIFIAVGAAVTLAVPALHSFAGLAVISLIAGIGSGVAVPLNLTNVANATDRHERPMAMSLESAASAFGRLCSSLSFGWMAGWAGLPAVFVVGNVLVLAAVGGLVRFRAPGLGAMRPEPAIQADAGVGRAAGTGAGTGGGVA